MTGTHLPTLENFMTPSLKRTTLAASVAFAFATPALAAPPTGTPYWTDPQSSHVWDQTAESIGMVNMITCFIDAMNPDELVNEGNYAALVDQRRCDSQKSSSVEGASSDSAGSSSAVMDRVIVNSSRASASAPMRVRAWVEEEDMGGDGGVIYVNVSATAGPSPTNPYGEFRMDFCGQGASPVHPCTMRGMLSGASDGIRFVQHEAGDHGGGPYQNDVALYLTRSGSTGAGAVQMSMTGGGGGGGGGATFRFAYDDTYFLRRNEGTGTNACFDRRLANAKTSVWRYGLYDENGNRVERNSGFPIRFAESGQTWFGFAGYWGVHLPPAGLAALTTGDSVVKQNFGPAATETSYTVMKAKGRLTRHTLNNATLEELNNLPFNFTPYQGLENATAGAIKSGMNNTTIRGMQLEAYWDNTASRFKVSGYLDCSPGNPCVKTNLATPVELTTADLSPYTTGGGLFGWSQSFGGNINFPAATIASPTGTSPVSYRTQSLVYPGQAGAPTTLHCVNNCPTATAIGAYLASSSPSPFGATANTWGPSASSVTYTVNASTGQLETGGAAAVLPDSATESQLGGNFRFGIRSGRLVPDLSSIACPGPVGFSCEFRSDELPVFYTWETGLNAWNQFVGLRESSGNFLEFDAPLSVTFKVPNNPPSDPDRYGPYAGSTMRLEYSGFGQLNGIPGRCVAAGSNQPVECGPGNNIRWVPAFSIPQDTEDGIVNADGTTYYVKWLEREVRFSQAPGACTGLASALGSVAQLPSASLIADPSLASDPTYIGEKPTVTAAPRVVDGVTKY